MSKINSENKIEIGIRLADGNFYSIFPETFHGSKKLVLTTVHDNQKNVQIDLYKGMGKEIFEDAYIGSLVLENLAELPKGELEIELLIGIDKEGNLHAEACEKKSGEKQALSVSLETLSSQTNYELPDLELEPSVTIASAEQEKTITGQTYPISKEDRRKSHLKKERRKTGRTVFLIIFLLLLLGGIGVGIYFSLPFFEAFFKKLFTGSLFSPQPPLSSLVPTQASSTPSETLIPSPEPEKVEGTWYTVVKGDTLWDLARKYYRDPFQYPRISSAPQNNIKDPNLIFEKQRLFIPAP